MRIFVKNITAMFVSKSHRTSHSVGFRPTPYIAVFISPQHKVILSTLKQKESLMRIENLIKEQIQAILDNLETWSCMYINLYNIKLISLSEF